jgi:hypothetical protein
MNISVIEKPGETIGCDMDRVAQDVRNMTSAQLRHLGVHSVVYLRSGMLNGEVAYAIHAADGTPMAVVEDVDTAVELVCEHGMAFAAVH